MVKRIIVFTLLFSVIRADTYQNVSDAKTRQFLARQALLNNMQFRVRSTPIMRPQVQQPLPQQQQSQTQAPQTTQQQQPLPQTQVINGQVNQATQVAGQHCPTCKQPVNVNNAAQNIINNRLANTNQYGQQNYGQQNLNNPVNNNQQANTKARPVFRNRFSNKRYRRFK